MLKKLNTNHAQVIVGEYLLVFFLVLGMITAMTIYIRRTLQGRIRDARYGMVDMVKTRTGALYAGTNVFRSYEPYYADTDSNITRDIRDTGMLFSSFNASSGIFRKNYDELISAQTFSNTAPPKDAY